MILHIGLHKTRTTFIQKYIFPAFKNITTIRAWHTHRNIIESNFKNQILITDEGISGNPFGGNYTQEFRRNVLNIKRLYGDVQIVFGVRKQEHLICSLYKQYLHQKGFLNVGYLFNESNSGVIKHEDLLFENKIAFLKREFSRVFVYSQEALHNGVLSFTEALSLFFQEPFDKNEILKLKNMKSNVGVSSNLQVEVLKRLNRFNAHKLTPDLYSGRFIKYKFTPRDICQDRLKKINSDRFELPQDIKVFICELYRDDWRNVQKYINT